MRSIIFAACFACVLPSATIAQNVALVIGNEDYDGVGDVRRGDEVAKAGQRLSGAGFEVIALADADAEEMREAMANFGQMATRSERLLVVLSGRFVHSPSETYFLPTDIEPQPLATLPSDALPLSTVLAYLSATPGQAILALATDAAEGNFGPFLDVGLGEIELPQGVTLIEAEPRTLARFLRNDLARPGRRLMKIIDETGVRATGFLAPGQVFVPEPEPEPAEETAPPAADTSDRLRDLLDWREADRKNTADAYRAYIAEHPDGQFVDTAESRIAELAQALEASPERTEQALDLNREQRREIQRDLSLLGYNTRGIDGIFGRGTRAAIHAWQEANGLEATGFLTGDQIARLDAQAERRAAELEEEAERRRQEQLAADRAFWAETGAVGDEAGLRIYLERYPDGEFAEIARARLDEIEREKRAETDARDRQLWDEARAQDTVQAYRDYLELAPGGAFRDEARERIAVLERDSQQSKAIRRAEAEERALNLSTRTRRVIEARLDALGLKPGPVDGVFDERTRRAIRRYQRARNLPETGYLNETVVVRLLADSVRSIFR